MNIKTLSDLEDHIRRIEIEDKIMQANLEANLRDITSRISFKAIVEQIVNEAKEDPGFVKKAAMAGAVLLVNHLPVGLGGKSRFSIVSALLQLAPTSQLAFAGEKATNQLLSWVHRLKEKRNKKSDSAIADSY